MTRRLPPDQPPPPRPIPRLGIADDIESEPSKATVADLLYRQHVNADEGDPCASILATIAADIDVLALAWRAEPAHCSIETCLLAIGRRIEAVAEMHRRQIAELTASVPAIGTAEGRTP